MEIINETPKSFKGIIVLKNNNIYTVASSVFNKDEYLKLIEMIENNPEEHCVCNNGRFLAYEFENYKIRVTKNATQSEINKCKNQKIKLINESYDDYLNKTLKYINTIPGTSSTWINNILNGTAEKERTLYTNDKFKIHNDIKTGTDINKINGLVFYYDKSLKSVRDLNEKHLDLLKETREQIYKIAKEKCGLDESEVMIYIHYLPSFWRFHVHFTSIYSSMYVSVNTNIDKSIQLNDIIQNIEIKHDYYQTVTLRFKVLENHELYNQF